MTKEGLLELREQCGLTQKAIADALGCSARAIFNYEKGLAPIPKYIALAASAFAMGLPPYGEKMK